MSHPTATDGESIVAAFVLMRNGDTLGTYELPYSYQASKTEVTALGLTQSYNLGALIQSKYLLRTSTSAINGVNPITYSDEQTLVKADLGIEGSVITASVNAAAQGIWPAIITAAKEVLADGSTVASPLNGYQYVQVQSVDPNTALYMNGGLSCNALADADNALYGQEPFLTVAQNNAAFISSMKTYVGDRPTLYSNIYDLYDYMNVNYIHNATFKAQVEPPIIFQLRTLANYNQWNLYSASDLTNIQNIAGQTMISEMMTVLGRFADPTDSLKFALYGTSYIPFISLFEMLGVTEHHPELQGIVNYAAAISLEVRQMANGTAGENYYVRFSFKNGTDDADFKPYPLFGQLDGNYDVPLAELYTTLAPYAVSNSGVWCGVCNNTVDRGCDSIALIEALSATIDDLLDNSNVSSHHPVSPAVAGVIGALLALVLATGLVVLLMGLRLMSWTGRKPLSGSEMAAQRRTHKKRTSSISGIVVSAVKKAARKGSDDDFMDTESTRGVIKNPGVYEMMDDVSELHQIPPKAPAEAHGYSHFKV